MKEIVSYIGAKLFYLGYRMQPRRVRRGLSVIVDVGLKWAEMNEDILSRISAGEHIQIGVGFTTKEMEEDD